MEKFQISCTITNNFINGVIWNLFISCWVVNLWEQYHFYFFTYAYHNITYTQFFIHQSQLFFNINICFEINAINFFLVKQCDKFSTYEFCFFSDLDTLNLKLDVMLFSNVQGEVVLCLGNPSPFVSHWPPTLPYTHTHTLSLSTNRHPPAMFGDSEHVSSNLSFCLFLFFQFLIGFEYLHTHLLGLAWNSIKH